MLEGGIWFVTVFDIFGVDCIQLEDSMYLID
jgi:hypothetical protein